MEADGITHLVEKEGDQLVLVAHGNDEARVESIQSLGGKRLRLVESLEESVTRFLDTAGHQVGRNLDERVVLELMVGVVLLRVNSNLPKFNYLSYHRFNWGSWRGSRQSEKGSPRQKRRVF